MALTFQLSFTGNINTSIQIGDSVFTSGGTSETDNDFTTSDYVNETTNSYSSDISFIGLVDGITVTGSGYIVDINPPYGALPPAANAYIFFSKNLKVNVSSLKGYYNAVRFRNNSKKKAELFSVSCGISVSSK